MGKQKILIVDDSEMNRTLLADILEDKYDIVEADNGAKAIELLSQQRTDFSLLLLDIMMPEMDGFEVLSHLYARQQRLEKIIAEQFYEQEKNNELMISILSHIVEFRNGESGLHIRNVNTITKYLLKQLVQLTDQYHLSKADISLISTASALHDI